MVAPLRFLAMNTTVTQAQFDNASQFRFSAYPWTIYKPNDDDVRRFAWGMIYKNPSQFCLPLENVNSQKRVVQQLRDMLEKMWGVTGTQEAHAAVQSLIHYGAHVEDDFLLPLAYSLKDVPEGELEGWMNEMLEFITHFWIASDADPSNVLNKFRLLVRVLRSDSFKAAHAPALPTTTLGWDLLRVHDVGAKATHIGWISEDEFLKYSDQVVEKLQHHFTSWADVAASFWWGRMAWVCDHEPDVANAMAEKTSYLTELIVYKDSPWTRVPLRKPSDGDELSRLFQR